MTSKANKGRTAKKRTIPGVKISWIGILTGDGATDYWWGHTPRGQLICACRSHQFKAGLDARRWCKHLIDGEDDGSIPAPFVKKDEDYRDAIVQNNADYDAKKAAWPE